MEPKIQSTTSTRALRSKIGPIKAYLFKTSYVISPITPSDLKHSMKGAYKSFLSKTDQAYGHSTSRMSFLCRCSLIERRISRKAIRAIATTSNGDSIMKLGTTTRLTYSRPHM